MKYFIQQALQDWAYKVNDGCPDPQNRSHIQVLEAVLRQYGCTEEFMSEYIPRVGKIHEDDIVKNKDTGNVYTVKNHNPDTQDLIKKDASDDEIASAKKGSKTEPTKAKRSSTGVHGNLEDGDNQDKHDVLEHGYKGTKDYYKKNKMKDPVTGEIKKPAPGSAGSAFNEIVSGEGIHILNNNPDMTEEELAEKMFKEFGQTVLGQEQSKSAGIDVPPRLLQAKLDAKGKGTNDEPENPDAFKKAEQQIATYSKCIIVARAAKDKHQITKQRISKLQEDKKFGTPKTPQTFYGTAASLKAQQTAVKNAKKVILPNGTTVRKEDVQELIRQSGGGLNPSDTATFIEDDKGTLMIQFHSDKTDPSDPQGSKSLSNDMADLEKRIDSNKTLSPEKKKAAQAVVKEYNNQMSGIENTYNDQTAAIAESLEQQDMDAQVDVIEVEMKKTGKHYLNDALYDSKGLKEKYKRHIPEGVDPNNMSNAEKVQAIRSFIKSPVPKEHLPENPKRPYKGKSDLKVISKIAEKLSKKMGKDAPDEINIKKVLAIRRTQVVDLHRDRKNKLNEVDQGPPPFGDREESQEVMEGFHLSILDDDEYNENETDQKKRLKSIMSGAFDIHMGGTVANRDTLREALGVKSLQDFKDKFRIEEEERYTYGDGGEKGGIVTGKVVYTYIIGKEGEDPIELGQKTYRQSDGPTSTTRTIIQYAKPMQERLKAAEENRSSQ
tara:strand:- start:8032 stop:10185 length:2154 start_codon:yes stop_codon:yes gene_type:complete